MPSLLSNKRENIGGCIRWHSNILINNLIFKASRNYMPSKSSEFEDNEFEDDFDDDLDNSEDDD